MESKLETYGDLKKLINIISKKQKGEKIISQGKVFALDQVLGLIPGASNAKTAFDFIKTAMSRPDTKKTNTWLDKLDIDDNMSKIIDDTVENGFMQAMAKSIESKSDDQPLEDDFNMNANMVDYLKKTYSGRTVTGINENKMKKETLRQIIKEEIKNILEEEIKQDSKITSISKDLDDQTSNFKGITNPQIMKQLLDAIVSKLDPKFKESTGFKTAVKAFYDNYK